MSSSAWADDFLRDGFAIVPDFVDGDWCERLRLRAEQLVDDFQPSDDPSIFTTKEQSRHSDRYFLESGDKVRFFFEEEAYAAGELRQDKRLSINKIGHALHALDTAFVAFSQEHPVAPLARSLGQRQPRLIQSMFIFKQPRIGGEVSIHQDSCFLFTEPLSVIGFWMALEDAHRENGCLWAIPGGHRGPLRQRFVRRGEGTALMQLSSEPFDAEQLVPLEVKRGTLIVLHGLLPHQSSVNRSDKSRHAYALHCVDAHCDYPDDNWLRPSRSSRAAHP